MEDLADFAMRMTPQQRQQFMAEALRQRGQSSPQLAAANENAHSMDMNAAMAPLMNNPGMVDSANTAAKNTQARFKPTQMGQQGFALPASGEFVESPMYTQERDAARDAARENVLSRTMASQQTARERLDAQAQMQHDRLAAQQENAARDRELRMTLGEMRLGQLREGLELRKTLAEEKANKPAKPKVLPYGGVKDLTAKEETMVGFNDLAQGFKDDYATGVIPGAVAAQNLGGRMGLPFMRQYGDQSNWWQNYNDKKNQIRHTLFGSALTATEKAAFDSANITESMAPAEVRRRLSQQSAATTRAYNKLKANAARAGYDMDGFPDYPEPEAPKPGAPANPGAPKPKPKRIVLDADGNEVK